MHCRSAACVRERELQRPTCGTGWAAGAGVKGVLQAACAAHRRLCKLLTASTWDSASVLPLQVYAAANTLSARRVNGRGRGRGGAAGGMRSTGGGSRAVTRSTADLDADLDTYMQQ